MPPQPFDVPFCVQLAQLDAVQVHAPLTQVLLPSPPIVEHGQLIMPPPPSENEPHWLPGWPLAP